MHKILILEDDAALRAETAEALEDEGFLVRTSGTVAAFWTEFARFGPELVILDLTLPDGRGSDVVRAVREKSTIGTLVLSGRQAEADRVIALEFGADDYVVKPCSRRELAARANAILRRSVVADRAPRDAGRLVSFAGYNLDLAAMALCGPDGAQVPLTAAEFNLLRVFVQRPLHVMSRDQLTDLARGSDWAGYDRAIDGLVSRLRKKIKSLDGAPLVKTVHGAGYVFTAEVSVV